ncbi:MAG: hypothetical protein LBG69_07570 [Zoogloeaceae bacterium]|nr:hypothetical protein [Zoogloeaceae bacterium]
MRVYRRDAPCLFIDPADTETKLIYEGDPISGLTDYVAIDNRRPYFYGAFYRVADSWSGGSVKSVTPSFLFRDMSSDVVGIVRDRLELGLRSYVERGEILHPSGGIPVLIASPLLEETTLPVVTVHLQSDAEEQDFIGGDLGLSAYEAEDDVWRDVEGYLSRYRLTIIAWSLNADERLAMRRAVKAVLLANWVVFDAAEMKEISMTFSDHEDFQSYAAPVYQAHCDFTCLAPSAVETDVPSVHAVISHKAV